MMRPNPVRRGKSRPPVPSAPAVGGCAGADQVWAGHQSQDREGSRPHRAGWLLAGADEVIE
jgi:hypothetical protein